MIQDLLPFVVAGVVAGSLYGLAATGLVLTYRTSSVFNFAHGAVAASAAFGQLRLRHLAMLEAYRQQRWDDAERLVAECRTLDPRLDDLYDVYQSRIRAMRQNPPGPGWNGVFVATSK